MSRWNSWKTWSRCRDISVDGIWKHMFPILPEKVSLNYSTTRVVTCSLLYFKRWTKWHWCILIGSDWIYCTNVKNETLFLSVAAITTTRNGWDGTNVHIRRKKMSRDRQTFRNSLDWFENYLTICFQFKSIKFGQDLSDILVIDHGVPKGSMLVPLCFNI